MTNNIKSAYRIPVSEKKKRIEDCCTSTQLYILHALERKYANDLEYLMPGETLLDDEMDISVEEVNRVHKLNLQFEDDSINEDYNNADEVLDIVCKALDNEDIKYTIHEVRLDSFMLLFYSADDTFEAASIIEDELNSYDIIDIDAEEYTITVDTSLFDRVHSTLGNTVNEHILKEFKSNSDNKQDCIDAFLSKFGDRLNADEDLGEITFEYNGTNYRIYFDESPIDEHALEVALVDEDNDEEIGTTEIYSAENMTDDDILSDLGLNINESFKLREDDNINTAMELMLHNNQLQDEPYVGPFWYDTNKKELFGVGKTPASELSFYKSSQLGGEVNTSHQLHKNIWQKEFYRKRDPRFKGDHTLIPGGRVFEFKDDGFKVLVGNWIDDYPEAKKEIIWEFQLPANTEFIKDSHWDLGHGFSDEFLEGISNQEFRDKADWGNITKTDLYQLRQSALDKADEIDNQYKEIAKKEDYFVTASSKAYDPEGTTSSLQDKEIVYAGTKEEAERYFNTIKEDIKKKAEKTKNDRYAVVFEEISDNCFMVYYMSSQSKTYFSIEKNSLKEDIENNVITKNKNSTYARNLGKYDRQTGEEKLSKDAFRIAIHSANPYTSFYGKEDELYNEYILGYNSQDNWLNQGDTIKVKGSLNSIGKVIRVRGDIVDVFFDREGTGLPDREDTYYLSEVEKINESLTENVKHLTDIIGKIDCIYVTDDARKSQLYEGDAKSKKEIDKYIISKEDVDKILDDLNQCDSIFLTPRDKNDEFRKKHNLRAEDYLDIIHQLKVSDYYRSAKSDNADFKGDDLIIFEPDHIEIKNKHLSNIIIYIKIDVTESIGNVVFISVHEGEQDDLPYMNESLNKDIIDKLEESKIPTIKINVIVESSLEEELPPYNNTDGNYDEQTLEDWYDFAANVETLVENKFIVKNINLSKNPNSLSEYIDFVSKDSDGNEVGHLIDLRLSDHGASSGARNLRRKKAKKLDPYAQLVSVIVNDRTFNSYEEALEYVRNLLARYDNMNESLNEAKKWYTIVGNTIPIDKDPDYKPDYKNYDIIFDHEIYSPELEGIYRDGRVRVIVGRSKNIIVLDKEKESNDYFVCWTYSYNDAYGYSATAFDGSTSEINVLGGIDNFVREAVLGEKQLFDTRGSSVALN